MQDKVLAGRAASALQRFIELVESLAHETPTCRSVQTDRA